MSEQKPKLKIKRTTTAAEQRNSSLKGFRTFMLASLAAFVVGLGVCGSSIAISEALRSQIGKSELFSMLVALISGGAITIIPLIIFIKIMNRKN